MVFGPIPEDECLQVMHRAINKRESKLCIHSTPISSRLAQLISNLLLLPSDEKWSLLISGSEIESMHREEHILPVWETQRRATFIECYPVDEDSRWILLYAFRLVRMTEFAICGMDQWWSPTFDSNHLCMAAYCWWHWQQPCGFLFGAFNIGKFYQDPVEENIKGPKLLSQLLIGTWILALLTISSVVG